MIEIEFDRAKDAANREKHGIALAAAAVLFEGPILRQPDDRFAYREERWLAIGGSAVTFSVCATRCAAGFIGSSACGARVERSDELMRKSQPKKKTTASRLHRPSSAEIHRAATQARRHADKLSDKALRRAIAAAVNTFGAEPSRLVLVRPDDLDVARIRCELGLTQAAFAAATGIPHRLISDWEQGRKKPSAAARAFLLLVDEFGDKALKRLARRAAA